MSFLQGPQFQAFLRDVFQLTVWLAILSAIFVPLERLFAAHPRRIFRREFGVDLCYYFLNSLLTAFLISVPLSLAAWLTRRTLPPGFLETMAGLPVWARASAAMIVGEVGYYWAHRLSHEIPFLWKFHAIHHSAEDVDFLTNTRAHPIDMVIDRFSMFVPIYVLGLGGPVGASGTLVPVLVGLFGTIWGFFIHANIRWRLGPLEWLISSPAFHHWHHTKSGPIDKNFSTMLPWMDWVFGSFYLPDHFPKDYGVRGNGVPHTLLDQLLYPLEGDGPAAAPVRVKPADEAVEPSGATSTLGQPAVVAEPAA
ncbi:sterol desaturase family protein [Aquisphaera insulae]|uniref:sterol desaturase family protein n=1 Tax=Aquisphaera insulae TaxID=2712864 RepID=UPI0013EA272C|nr:sterol desaturase family protein [Aquisphaera insulae]